MKLNWLANNLSELKNVAWTVDQMKVIRTLQEVNFDIDCLTINEIKVLDLMFDDLLN